MSSKDAVFKAAIAKALEEGMEKSKLTEDVFLSRLFSLFPASKPATLPREVIEAASLYNTETHRSVLKEWLKSQSKNAVDEAGRSLLHYATVGGRLKLVNYFIDKKKFPIEFEDGEGYTALIYAVQQLAINKDMAKKQRDDIVACIDALLQKKAKVVSSHPVFPQVAVAIAAQFGDLEVLQLLEKHGASLKEEFMGHSILWLAEHSQNSATNPVIPYLHGRQASQQSQP